MTSFWKLYFSAPPLLSWTPSTTEAWSANWWLVCTSLFLEVLGCGTLVQSRFYKNLSVCIGFSSRLLLESQKFGFRYWFSVSVFFSLLMFKLNFLLSSSTARKDSLLGIILHKFFFLVKKLQIQRRHNSACLILCSGQWLPGHMETSLCDFFLVGKQCSQARLELGFWFTCNWPVTEVRMEPSRSIGVLLSSTGADYIPLGICSPLRKEEHTSWALGGLTCSLCQVMKLLLLSVKWLWLCWRWWDLHHLPALWTQIVSIKALSSGNVFSCAPFLPSLWDEQHTMASHHLCKSEYTYTKR